MHAPRCVPALLFLLACGGDDQERELTRSFGPIHIAPGAEITEACVTWALGNEEPIYATNLEMSAGPGWHHSNWFAIAGGTAGIAGTKSVEECTPEYRSAVDLTLLGGVLIFGQSTQSQYELQELPPGAVLELPPNAVIVGDLHLYNASDEELDTELTLAVRTTPPAPEQLTMRALGLAYQSLEIPPKTRSSFTMECPLGPAHVSELGRPLDYKLHYVMPHYHSLAEGMRVEIMGGPSDGELVLESGPADGGELGKTFDPPRSLEGADGLRITCSYNNTSDKMVGWGNGDQEMCAFGAFVDSDANWLGGALSGNTPIGDVSGTGVMANTGACSVVSWLK